MTSRQFNQNSRSSIIETIKLSSGKVLRFAKKGDRSGTKLIIVG